MTSNSSAYKEVETLVGNGDLRIIHIDAPPRTISSALQIALTESAHGHIYEPFRQHALQRDKAVNFVCADILKIYQDVRRRGLDQTRPRHHYAPKNQVVITIKELAQYLKTKNFDKWLPLVGGWVSLVRSPNTQMQSFMTRSILNGNHFSAGDIDTKRQELSALLGRAPSEHELVYSLSEEFRPPRRADGAEAPHKLATKSYDMWGMLSEHHARVEKTGIPQVVIDGTILCTNPKFVLEEAARALQLPFTERMVAGGWTVASGDKLIPNEQDIISSAWIADAVSKRGWSAPENQPLPLSMFSPSVRAYTEKALEHFVDFFNSTHAIVPRTNAEIHKLFAATMPKGVPFGMTCRANTGTVFCDTQPIAAYAVALSMPTPTQRDEAFRSGFKVALEKVHSDQYGDSFAIMANRQALIDRQRAQTIPKV